MGFSSLNIKDQSVNFLAGVFLPRPLKDLAEDEQYMQENGIGDIDVIMGFNNMEGSLVLFMLHFAQLPPESLYSPQFFHTIADICLMLNQVHENQVVRKVSAYLSVFLSVSCQSVCLPASLSPFLWFFFFFVFYLKSFHISDIRLILNYDANNMCQQVAPIIIRRRNLYKTTTKLIYSQQTTIYAYRY